MTGKKYNGGTGVPGSEERKRHDGQAWTHKLWPQQCGWLIPTLIAPHFTVHSHHHRCLLSPLPFPRPLFPPILFHDARSETPINISDFSRSNASEGSVRPRRCAAHPDPWPADPLKTTEKGPSSFSAAPCRKVRHEAHKVNSCGPCAAPYTGA